MDACVLGTLRNSDASKFGFFDSVIANCCTGRAGESSKGKAEAGGVSGGNKAGSSDGVSLKRYPSGSLKSVLESKDEAVFGRDCSPAFDRRRRGAAIDRGG